MKAQKYQVVIRDKLPNTQVLKLWDLLGLKVKDHSSSNDVNYLKDITPDRSFFTFEKGVFSFHGSSNLLISTKDIAKQVNRLNGQSFSSKNQPFAKALGLNNRKEGNWILDGTLGLGKDYFLANAFGFKVIGMEKSSLCFALLGTFLLTAGYASESKICFMNTEEFLINYNLLINPGDELANNAPLLCTDTYGKGEISLLSKMCFKSPPSAIYLDPMYDEKNETALPNKFMQVLRGELGSDDVEDFEKLFMTALKIAKDRVILKRSKKSDIKFKKYFSFSCEGKSTRYDVYLNR